MSLTYTVVRKLSILERQVAELKYQLRRLRMRVRELEKKNSAR